MNIAITAKVHAQTEKGFGQTTSFKLLEDRVTLMHVGSESILFDALAMIELYQTHYEVVQCLRKTQVRSTYIRLLEWRHLLETEIDARILAASSN